jgi:hypothetical protein
MMKTWSVLVLLGAAGVLAGQPTETVMIRSLMVQGAPDLPEVTIRQFQPALAEDNVPFAVEKRVTRAELEDLATRAAAVLERLYAERGRAVEVGYEIEPLPPRAVGVKFRVSAAAR